MLCIKYFIYIYIICLYVYNIFIKCLYINAFQTSDGNLVIFLRCHQHINFCLSLSSRSPGNQSQLTDWFSCRTYASSICIRNQSTRISMIHFSRLFLFLLLSVLPRLQHLMYSYSVKAIGCRTYSFVCS